jgi:hypothetical protein
MGYPIRVCSECRGYGGHHMQGCPEADDDYDEGADEEAANGIDGEDEEEVEDDFHDTVEDDYKNRMKNRET